MRPASEASLKRSTGPTGQAKRNNVAADEVLDFGDFRGRGGCLFVFCLLCGGASVIGHTRPAFLCLCFVFW